MPKFGLIGYPIGHSQSPSLFKEWCGGKWPYDLIETEDFDKAWDIFLREYDAVNITAPFKEKALLRCDSASRECRKLGAANIAVKTPEGVVAYNSDYLAVKEIIKERGLTGVALIVGYGGAGKAAALAARDAGLDVVVCNRTVSKGEGIRPLGEIPVLVPVADIVIYTLPLMIPEMEGLEMNCVLEANYRNPSLSKLKINDYIAGLEWLKKQAVAGYPLLTLTLTK